MLRVATLVDFLHGAGITIAGSVLAISTGIPLGLVLAAGRTGGNLVLRAACATYSSFVRAVPGVTFVMLIYFGLPALGVAFDPLSAPVLAAARDTPSFTRDTWPAGDVCF